LKEINAASLAGQPFLRGMARHHLELLAASAMPAEFEAGETIFKEGDPANRFYLIHSGKISLESPGQPEQEPALIETVGGGDPLGWSWLFPPYYWHFNARAVTPVTAIFFYGTRLREQCENDRDFGYELLKRVSAVVVHRLQATRRRLAEESKKLQASF